MGHCLQRMTSGGRRVHVLGVMALSLGVVIACSSTNASSPSCPETGCGLHGRCAIDAEGESCVCDTGHAGPTCSECAPGFQDLNGNGFCSPACGSLVCGRHERCSDASGRAACSCVTGYSFVGSGCSFTGTIVDPSFEDPNAWAVTGAATIVKGRPSDIGNGGGNGWVRFSGAGEVFQSFDMPTFAEAEPLALEVDYRCAQSGGCANVSGPRILRFGERLSAHAVSGTMTLRVCLGEAAFGRNLRLGIWTEGAEHALGPQGDMLVGRAQIVPNAACAAPGTVKNGDFESGNWRITSKAGRVDFVREDDTRRARLTSSCEGAAQIATSISVPEALPSPALEFSIEGTAGGETSLLLGETTGFSVVGTGTKKRARRCLPAASRGLAFELRVAAAPAFPCEPTRPNVVHVDDFAIVSDPSCTPAGGDEPIERPF